MQSSNSNNNNNVAYIRRSQLVMSPHKLLEYATKLDQLPAYLQYLQTNPTPDNYDRVNFIYQAQLAYREAHPATHQAQYTGNKYALSAEAKSHLVALARQQGYIRANNVGRGLTPFVQCLVAMPVNNFYDNRPNDLRAMDAVMVHNYGKPPVWFEYGTLQRYRVRLLLSPETKQHMTNLCTRFMISNYKRGDSILAILQPQLSLPNSAHAILLEAIGLQYLCMRELPTNRVGWATPNRRVR